MCRGQVDWRQRIGLRGSGDHRHDGVVAGRCQARDAGELDETALATAAGEDGDEVDGLGDERAGDGDDGFLNQLLEPAERAESAAGVDGANAAGMAGAPGLEEVERLRAADLADRNAVGAEPQGGTHQRPHGDLPGPLGVRPPGLEVDHAGSRELELGGILADEMGLGKTRPASCVAADAVWSFETESVIVFGPKTVVEDTWPEELQKWAYTKSLRFVVLNGTERDIHRKLDLPNIDTVLVEVPNPGHPFGVRGVGEAAFVAPLPAVANAVAHALGQRMYSLPMSPRRILEAMWADGAEGSR